jgi:uncharacterized protein (DUF433 family)
MPGESDVAGGLAIVAGQRIPESLIHTFVDQNAHLGTREQEVFCFLECSDRRFIKNPDILGGTPVFRGTRVPIETLFDDDSHGMNVSRAIVTSASRSHEPD